MARTPAAQALLRPAVARPGPRDARQPARQVRRGRQGPGVRLLGQLHRGRADEEHRGRRLPRLPLIRGPARPALRIPRRRAARPPDPPAHALNPAEPPRAWPVYTRSVETP